QRSASTPARPRPSAAQTPATRTPATQTPGQSPPGKKPSALPSRGRATGPMASSGGIDGNLFDELTAADSAPVYVAPKMAAGTGANPYANTSALEKYVNADDLRQFELASREKSYVPAHFGLRLVGFLIDIAFTGAISISLFFIALFAFGAANVDLGEDVGPTGSIFWLGVGCYLFPTMVHWILISKRGQSLGKVCVGTVMVDEPTGEVVGFGQGVGKRWFAFNLITNIPVVGTLIAIVNPFFVFSDRGRTLHDRVAGTVVAVRSSVV
ncbi:MAG: RDD family protein, partial [Planctomycetota bacterium]